MKEKRLGRYPSVLDVIDKVNYRVDNLVVDPVGKYLFGIEFPHKKNMQKTVAGLLRSAKSSIYMVVNQSLSGVLSDPKLSAILQEKGKEGIVIEAIYGPGSKDHMRKLGGQFKTFLSPDDPKKQFFVVDERTVLIKPWENRGEVVVSPRGGRSSDFVSEFMRDFGVLKSKAQAA